MVSLPRKVYSYMNLGATVQKLIFHDGGGGHLGFGPLEKMPRMVTELRF